MDSHGHEHTERACSVRATETCPSADLTQKAPQGRCHHRGGQKRRIDGGRTARARARASGCASRSGAAGCDAGRGSRSGRACARVTQSGSLHTPAAYSDRKHSLDQARQAQPATSQPRHSEHPRPARAHISGRRAHIASPRRTDAPRTSCAARRGARGAAARAPRRAHGRARARGAVGRRARAAAARVRRARARALHAAAAVDRRVEPARLLAHVLHRQHAPCRRARAVTPRGPHVPRRCRAGQPCLAADTAQHQAVTTLVACKHQDALRPFQ